MFTNVNYSTNSDVVGITIRHHTRYHRSQCLALAMSHYNAVSVYNGVCTKLCLRTYFCMKCVYKNCSCVVYVAVYVTENQGDRLGARGRGV